MLAEEIDIRDWMRLRERLRDFVYAYWKRTNMERWPSVRQAARSLRVSFIRIEELATDEEMMLTCGEDERLGDSDIESMRDPRIDADLSELRRKAA